MKLVRNAGMLAVALAGSIGATSASAQFFLQSRDMTGARVTGSELGIALPMTGATVAEQRAGLVWTLRAALNVAALQCQFEPTILSVTNYNAVLRDHKDELKTSFDTLTRYFARTAKTKVAAQAALDTFSTRTYASVTPVAAQYGFCQTANIISRDAVFTPRGKLGDLAEARMQELRNSLVPWGEQKFPRYIGRDPRAAVPRLDAICWSKKGEWVDKKCGAFSFPQASAGVVAAR